MENMTAISFDGKEFMNELNSVYFRNKFNGINCNKGREVVAKSSMLDGIEEFGQILAYAKKGRSRFFQVEFCGDRGIWIEFVNVLDCKPYNGPFSYGA